MFKNQLCKKKNPNIGFFFLRRTGLEPAHLAASAPQADVSTIPPPPQLKWILSDNQKKVNRRIKAS